ncbi:hypothetical protein [Niveibacterium sp.]|uniref:hypothetical protein n=1 Tax=Niveibacterium sp. TaxID=2017444 RepID=UPI0035AF2F9F
MDRIWLLVFSSLGINGVFLILVADRLGWPTFKEFALHPATAAWIQAIGSIGAIAAAAWVVQRQHLLEEQRRSDDKVDARVELINGALLILFSQINVLLVYRKQILDPERSNPVRHFALPATQTLEYDHWIVDWQKLAFLIESNAKDVLMDAMLAHNAFHSAIKSVNERVQFHRADFQHRMEASSLDFTKEVLAKDIAEAAGPRITQTLVAATDDLYEQVDTAIKHLTRVGESAPKILRDLFKGHQVIGFSPPNGHA